MGMCENFKEMVVKMKGLLKTCFFKIVNRHYLLSTYCVGGFGMGRSSLYSQTVYNSVKMLGFS